MASNHLAENDAQNPLSILHRLDVVSYSLQELIQHLERIVVEVRNTFFELGIFLLDPVLILIVNFEFNYVREVYHLDRTAIDLVVYFSVELWFCNPVITFSVVKHYVVGLEI